MPAMVVTTKYVVVKNSGCFNQEIWLLVLLPRVVSTKLAMGGGNAREIDQY